MNTPCRVVFPTPQSHRELLAHPPSPILVFPVLRSLRFLLLNSEWFRLRVTLALALGLLVLTGCRTAPPDSIAAFSGGVTAARTQSQEAFSAVNELVADASVDYAASQPRLMESSFAAGLDADSLQAWDQVLEKLETYARHLQALSSPQLAKPFEDATVSLSGELKDFGQHLQQAGLANKSPQISPGLATDFTELADILIRLHARARVRDALQKTDAEVGRICRRLADCLGDTRTNGLRGTVNAHWNQQLAEQKAAFLNKTDFAGRRAVAAVFRKELQNQTAQDLILLSLRRSLLQLADLHHALAQGTPLTAQSAAAAIAAEVEHTRDLYNRFTAKPSEP